MTTVTDPALTEIFFGDTHEAGLPLKGSQGFGRLDGSRGVYRANCRTGPVIFMVDQLDKPTDEGVDLTRELLPGYVAVEAERIGCGPEKVTLPNAWVRAGAGPRWAGGTGDTVRTPRPKIRGARIMLTAAPVGAPG
ncbi:hypothetical protein [Streptomyces sp. Ncost-T10-10d]|uniref:hypothetical protein n=1 Tax=Streptomyces sp. Ncost-T10-10d TaxID=1839774 RepID=UPI00081ED43B|nr:hypothetical protein [Streptomyces sp. Ncost-T10-10d]SCF58456.1 hypothetical protein GA0115254_105569 [Streptomyces sp. Ncost-T10-10d]